MKGPEMKRLRLEMNLDRLQFARMLGYTGTDRNDVTRIRVYENQRKQIPLYIARLVWLLAEMSRMMGSLPAWPAWPGYDFDHTPDQEPEQADGAKFY
jgi:hypothetical protein